MSALLLVSMNVAAEDPDFYEVGDEWAYDVTMEYGSLTLEGAITYSMIGLSTVSVAGVPYEVYEIAYEGDLSIDGQIESVAVEGEATMTGKGSMEVNTLDMIRNEANMSMEFEAVLIIPVSVELWEYQITTYSPPGGVGEEPEDLTEGVSWTITYTEYYESMSYDSLDGGGVQTDSGSSTVTETYTYIGERTTTVPAGTFGCEVYQVDDGDSIETNWYCEDVGANVKEVYESGTDETGEMVLMSYSFGSSASDDDNMMMYLIVGSIAAVVAVVAVVALLMLRKKPAAPQMMPGEPAKVPAPMGTPVEPPPVRPPPRTPSQ